MQNIRMLYIRWTLIGITIFLLLSVVACSKPKPKMTAYEVCQYVNQALPNEYTYSQTNSTIRLVSQFTALDATYQTAEERWLVNVKRIIEPQLLKELQWIHYPNKENSIQTLQYYFSETTGAVALK